MSLSFCSQLVVLRGVGLFGFFCVILGEVLVFTDSDGKDSDVGTSDSTTRSKNAFLISCLLFGINVLVNIELFFQTSSPNEGRGNLTVQGGCIFLLCVSVLLSCGLNGEDVSVVGIYFTGLIGCAAALVVARGRFGFRFGFILFEGLGERGSTERLFMFSK